MSTLNKLYDIRGLRKAGVAKKLGVKGAGAESGEGRWGWYTKGPLPLSHLGAAIGGKLAMLKVNAE